MEVKERNVQRELERSEGLLVAIDKRLPVAEKESEIAKTKAISKPNDMDITDLRAKSRVVENLLDIKIVILKNIGRIIKEVNERDE